MDLPFNFGGLPAEFTVYKKCKFVVLSVPFDATSTWIKGADNGPSALIDASMNMELYDIETDSEAYKSGIFTDRLRESEVHNNSCPAERDSVSAVDCDCSVEELADRVEKRVRSHVDAGKIVCLIGGEHSVSIGAIRAHAGVENFSVLQLDAHADLRDEYEGSKCNHACVMSRAREVAKIVQVGIRSMDICEKGKGDDVFFAHEIVGREDWIAEVVAKLGENVYVTVDLDVFDSSIMPSTGTPEPGGLQWYPVLKLLKEVFASKNIVGFDVVELCPNSVNKAPDFLAAKLVYKMMGYIAESR